MKKWAIFLLILGLMQIAGDLTGWRVLKGFAAATGASPAPKVFGSVKGLETFSSKFFIEWEDRAGQAHRLQLTAAETAKLAGPYNRRNVYGAVLAYGPVLPASLRDPVLRYALSGEAPLLREIGIDPDDIASTVRIVVEPKAPVTGLPLVFEERVR